MPPSVPQYTRNRNAFFTDSIQEIIEDIVIKKHLGRQKFAACIHLPFQVVNVHLYGLCFWMAFRVTCPANAEVPKIPDFLNKLTGMVVLVRQREFQSFRDIPPQR